MVTDQQVRRLSKLVQTTDHFGTAAAKAGMDGSRSRRQRRIAGDDQNAAGLLQGVSATESELRAKAQTIVEENWPIIEAIAGKLLEHNELQPDEWRIIIDAIDEGEDWGAAFFKMREITDM